MPHKKPLRRLLTTPTWLLTLSRRARSPRRLHCSRWPLKAWRKSTPAEAAKSSAQTAQQSLHIGERPYVTPFDPVFLQDPEHSLTAVQVRLAFLNSGRTPAIRTQAKLRIFIDDNELPQIVKFPAAITIASERSCSVDFEITKRDLTGVTEGTRLFYVKGTVSYTDVFKADNSTTFCSVYDAHSR